MPPLPASADELHPHLLYSTEAGHAAFATWRLADGRESLVIFTTAEAAEKYRCELTGPQSWTVYQPPRDKLVAIFSASLSAGIRIAALDPVDGGARTLFDIPQVVAAAGQSGAG